MHFIEVEEFNGKYYTYDFDNMLIEQDNDYVNSNEHYLEYKNYYLETTQMNAENLRKLIELIEDKNTSDHTNKKYTYFIFNKKLHDDTNTQIKELLVQQNQLYNNFITHIHFLNKIKTNTIVRKQILPSHVYNNISNRQNKTNDQS